MANCFPILDSPSTGNVTDFNPYAENLTRFPDNTSSDFVPNESIHHPNPTYESIKFYLAHVVSPALCLIGITGNILNVLVLSRRRIRSSIDGSMEKPAYMGLIALAVSDLLFCLCTLPAGFIVEQQSLFHQKSFSFYYSLSKNYLQNVFSHMSTWLTVIIAVSRYAAVRHPLHAKIFVHAKGTRLAIFLVFLIWPCLDLPSLWALSVLELPVICGERESVVYLFDSGPFSTNKSFNMAFRNLWSTLGYLIPVCVLVFCNIALTCALRERFKPLRTDYRIHVTNRSQSSRITPTLICMIFMFIILVSPSEIVQFSFFFNGKETVEVLMLFIAFTNILHTLNFTINFLLYCILSSHFRKTLRNIFCTKRARIPSRHSALCTITYSNGTSKIYGGPASSETVL